MSLTQLNTRAQLGIDAPSVSVEVHISNGLPAFTVVGLPETAVREARDRVRSAILNTGFKFMTKTITRMGMLASVGALFCATAAQAAIIDFQSENT